MKKQIARTFYVERPQGWEVLVEEMHINYWLESLKNLIVDIGLLLVIPTDTVVGRGNLQLRCGLQVAAADDEPRMLDTAIADVDVARWLFNDNLEITRLPANGNAPIPATAIKKSDGETFLLFPSTAVIEGGKREVCVVRLDLDCAPEAAIRTFSRDNAVRVYTRFQYKAGPTNQDGYSVDRGLLRNHILLDGRFNDIRAMPPNVAQDRFVSGKTLRLFLIHPLDFRVSLQPIRFKQYERLLERGQAALKKYFYPQRIWPESGLIHQWKFTRTEGKTSESGQNVLLILDCPKGVSEKVVAALVLLSLAGGALFAMGHHSMTDATKSIGDALIALIIAVALGLSGDLLIRGLKGIARRVSE